MEVCFNDMLYAFSYALDCVEHSITGVSTNHSMRVAYICVEMGKRLGLTPYQLSDLAACAVLHDNALTEYLHEEYRYKQTEAKTNPISSFLHCELGQDNVKDFPFFGEVEGVILYHHENADGSGPYGKKADEIPLYAALIHLADKLDLDFDLNTMNQTKYKRLAAYLHTNRDKAFQGKHCTLFLDAFPLEHLSGMGGLNAKILIRQSLPRNLHNFEPQQIIGFARIFAKIIDYKSTFTCYHSLGLAEKAAQMMRWYGESQENIAAMYFAGAVHDIGKLVIDTDILEKKGKLTNKEYLQMKNHAYWSYKILSQIQGLEELTRWAALHHEKLDGSGYPFGYTAEQLGFKERLMACLDIYQALTEKRPYKVAYTHEKSIQILRNMAKKGVLDGKMVEDIDQVFGIHSIAIA